MIILYLLFLANPQQSVLMPQRSCCLWCVKESRMPGRKGAYIIYECWGYTHELPQKWNWNIKSKGTSPPLTAPSSCYKVRFSTFVFYLRCSWEGRVGEGQFNAIRTKLPTGNDRTYWKIQWERKFLKLKFKVNYIYICALLLISAWLLHNIINMHIIKDGSD